MSDQAYFHADSASVRFWVTVGDQQVGAMVSKAALHYRFMPHASDDDALVTYRAHADELAAVVRRRVAGGSIEPVMLREFDLRPLPAA